jgi:phosphatidylserine/phosphatidylglycerophosphate/cardiolipin synthase-like enzyme
VTSARSIRLACAILGLGAANAHEVRRYHRAAKDLVVEDPPAPGTAEFARLVEVLTVAPLRQGNRVKVLRNGCEIFPAMLEAIRAARHTIEFATYVYWTGSIAPEFADALAERAAAGVTVNVLLDAIGAAKMDRELIDRLQAAGAEVAWFRPPRWYTLNKLNNRTHRKILFEYQRTMLHAKTLLVDDHWATVGSINFDNRSFALNDELNISFRDPRLVAILEGHFLDDLQDARELDDAGWRPRPLPKRTGEIAAALVRREL